MLVDVGVICKSQGTTASSGHDGYPQWAWNQVKGVLREDNSQPASRSAD